MVGRESLTKLGHTGGHVRIKAAPYVRGQIVQTCRSPVLDQGWHTSALFQYRWTLAGVEQQETHVGVAGILIKNC
jgi:hypothetical protein